MGRREEFDPLRSYVAARTFTWKGAEIKEGQPFNDRSDMRRFRQLYDGRFTRMTEVDSGTPDFARMTADELRKWLVDHGQPNLAQPNSTHPRLVERCRRIWLKEAQPDGVTTRHDDTPRGGEGIQKPAASRDNPAGGVQQRERFG
jgi:hypothetical protein